MFNSEIFAFQCFEVQPNDGFGTLLPLESVDIDIIFSAKKAQVLKYWP